MPGVAGYKAQLKLGGTPTLFNDEPLVKLSELSSSIYRVDSEIFRVLSANHPIVIRDNITTDVIVIDSNRINYLEGIFNFQDIDMDGVEPYIESAYYIPLLYIGGSKDYSLEIGGDVLDSSAFHSENTLSAGFREKTYGIHDVSCSFSRWNDFSNRLTEAKLNKTSIFVSINPGASKTLIKGWFQTETDSLSGDIGSLEQEDISLVLCGNNSLTYFSYSYQYTNTELEFMSEEDLIANWFYQ